MTIVVEEDGQSDHIIYEGDISNNSSIGDTVNSVLTTYKRNADANVNLRFKFKEECGVCGELLLPFYKWSYVTGITGTINYLDQRVGANNRSDDDVLKLYFSKTPNPSESDLIEYYYGKAGQDPDIDGNGIYYLYCVLCPKLSPNVATVRPMCLTKPYAYYKGVTQSQTDTVQFPNMTLPSQTYIDYEPNTGKASFYIDIDYPDNGYDYSQYRYMIRLDEVRNGNKYGDIFELDSEITVNTGTKKKVYIVAYDSNGAEIAKSIEQELDLTVTDNQPPHMDIGGNRHASYNENGKYRYYLTVWDAYTYPYYNYYGPYDIDAKLDKVVNDNPIDCFLVPVSYGTTLTKDELDSGLFRKITVPLEENYIEKKYLSIPYDGLEFGSYYIYFYIKDKSDLNNWSITLSANNSYYALKHYITNYVPEITYEDNKLQIKSQAYNEKLRRNRSFPQMNTSSNSNYDYQIHSNYANIKILNDDTWSDYLGFKEYDNYGYENSSGRMKNSTGDSVYSNPKNNNNNEWIYSIEDADLDEFAGKFLQVYVNFSSGIWRYSDYGQNRFDMVQSQPVYVYPDYMRYKGTDNKIVCNNKNWVEGANGYQIFTDNPVFIHTLYCSKNLNAVLKLEKSYATTEEYIREWESRAQETGIVTYTGTTNTSFTYGNNNYKEIPDGSYYVTIAHFADGTTLMGDVKQK